MKNQDVEKLVQKWMEEFKLNNWGYNLTINGCEDCEITQDKFTRCLEIEIPSFLKEHPEGMELSIIHELLHFRKSRVVRLLQWVHKKSEDLEEFLVEREAGKIFEGVN